VDQVSAMGIPRGLAGDQQDSRIAEWGLRSAEWQSHINCRLDIGTLSPCERGLS
jgi:hypothetical protein